MGMFLGGGLLLGSLMMAQWSAAATYHVAPGGADNNPGTADQPFRTVRVGVQALASGDTLYLRAGTYGESIDSGLPTGTSWSDAPLIAAYPGETVRIRGIAVGSYVQYIIFDGLILDSGDAESFRLWIEGAHHIRVQNCEIRNARLSGVALFASFNEIINCKVHDNGSTDFDHGLYITGSNNLVEGSQIYHNAGWGVHIYTGTGSGADNNIVRDNEIYENAWVGARGTGIILSSGTGNIAEGNRIWSNHDGIHIDYGSIGSQAFNNEVYDNQQYGIIIGDGSQGAVVYGNKVYDNSGGNIVNYGSGSSISQ